MLGGRGCTFNCKCVSFCMLCSRTQSTNKGFSTKLQKATVDCLFADWQYCLIVFIAWFSFLFSFNFCFFVASSKYFLIRMHILLSSSLLSAGRWQLWSCYGSAFLDQLEWTDCKQLKLLLQLARHFERKIKLPWLQMGCSRDCVLQ